MSRKLVDDCFRTDPRDGQRMTHDATLALIRERVGPVVSIASTNVGDALGRVLAEDVAAPISVPGHTNSAVDGFAFAAAGYDQKSGSRFPVVARIAAGVGSEVTVSCGEAVRIFTGAVMPAAVDTVVMQEDCEIVADGRKVVVPGGLKAGANVRRAGEDVTAGSPVLRQGQIIRAPDIA
ncbi:MAG: molybdopterin molybdenumtransferase MoeA, partial [Alphaproteobacteria bacterium]|nr:molybdopterin molybdenumtransferase MoeA [Alphaproteobacteria bacterium]